MNKLSPIGIGIFKISQVCFALTSLLAIFMENLIKMLHIVVAMS